jgi:hypothetical protein
MENLLRSKEYWSLIETGVVTAPANATAEQRKAAEDSKLRDLKVKNYLFQAIDRSILETILVRDLHETFGRLCDANIKAQPRLNTRSYKLRDVNSRFLQWGRVKP